MAPKELLSLFKMPRMMKEDDPEVYIESFEQTALQVGLDHSQWAHQLGALVLIKLRLPTSHCLESMHVIMRLSKQQYYTILR